MKPIFVGITGGSGSGKSWLAHLLRKSLGSDTVALIEQDWYYRDLSHLPQYEAAKTDFDNPQAIEFDLLKSHMDALANGDSIEAPQYEFAKFSRKKERKTVCPRPIIIVEGLFVLHQSDLAKLLDISIFVDTPSDLRLLRRIRRDLSERGYQLDRVLNFWETNEIPSFEKFVFPQRASASVIWDSLEDSAFVPSFLADLQNRTTRDADQPTP